MADQLCTTAQVKARVEVTDAADDVLISELIDQVSDWIQDTTGRKLVPEAGVTWIVDTGAGSVIEVHRGVRAVTSLSIATSDQPDDGSGTYTAVAAADILLRPLAIDRKPGWPATRILLRGSSGGRLVAALNGAKMVIDGGFAATPPVIQAVAIDAVVTAFNSRQSVSADVIGAEGASVFPWARFFSRGSPQRATIDRYRAGMGIA